jgi:hypothetical protein
MEKWANNGGRFYKGKLELLEICFYKIISA